MCFLFLKFFYLGYFYFGEVAHSCFIGFTKNNVFAPSYGTGKG